jgi:hypothetical protein
MQHAGGGSHAVLLAIVYMTHCYCIALPCALPGRLADAPSAPTTAGLPANDLYYFCPTNGSTCYFYNTTTAPYTTHKLACSNLGGYLVSWNT